MNAALRCAARLCALSVVAVAIGCSSPPPPTTESDEKPETKTLPGGIERGETLEAPPPPPGAQKK